MTRFLRVILSMCKLGNHRAYHPGSPLTSRLIDATSKWRRSWAAAAKDRAAAISAVTKRDGLLKAETERARMDWVLDKLVLTPNVRQNGIGNMNQERMERGINVIKEGFQLTTAPTMEQIYDGRFLPPAADRKLA